jgi:putative LysE/RhtB family amino acid efflux pump
MDSLSVLVTGVLIGLSVAAPLGPNGLLCINRTLSGGRTAGFASGLGAAVVHLLYAVLASAGLSGLSFWLGQVRAPVLLLSGAYLGYLGWKYLRAKPVKADEKGNRESLAQVFLAAVLLTFSNPLTVVKFLVLFVGIKLDLLSDPSAILLLPLGVFLGSAVWWGLLSSAISLVRAWCTPPRMVWVNRASGLFILALGLNNWWQVLS